MKKAFKIFFYYACHRNSADSYFRCYGASEKNFFINFLML